MSQEILNNKEIEITNKINELENKLANNKDLELSRKEKFDKVQYILDRQAKANEDGSIDILSRFLKCKCCGGNMVKQTSKGKFITIALTTIEIKLVKIINLLVKMG